MQLIKIREGELVHEKHVEVSAETYRSQTHLLTEAVSQDPIFNCWLESIGNL